MANQLGKVYICGNCKSQVIVTKGGSGQLKCCGVPMEQKKWRARSIVRAHRDNENEVLKMIGAIIVGIIAGWLAGKLLRGEGFGLLGGLVPGLRGGLIGGFVLKSPHSMLGALLVAAIGAVILVWISH